MYYRTKKMTMSKTLTEGLLGALTAIPGAALMVTPTVILYTAGGPPTPDTTVASLTVADFPGYGAATITFSGPVVVGGTDFGRLAGANFICTGTPIPGGSLLGYAVTDGASAIYGSEAFPAPMVIGQDGDFLSLDIIMPIPAVYSPTVV